MYVVINILLNSFQKFIFTLIHCLLPKLTPGKRNPLHPKSQNEIKFIDREKVLAQSIYRYQPLLQIKHQLIRTIQKEIFRKKKDLERILNFLEKIVIHDHCPVISYCWEYGGFNFRYRKKFFND